MEGINRKEKKRLKISWYPSAGTYICKLKRSVIPNLGTHLRTYLFENLLEARTRFGTFLIHYTTWVTLG